MKKCTFYRSINGNIEELDLGKIEWFIAEIVRLRNKLSDAELEIKILESKLNEKKMERDMELEKIKHEIEIKDEIINQMKDIIKGSMSDDSMEV